MPPPTWERSLLAFFDDLEQQAAGLHLAERQHEVHALAVAEFTGVTLESRLLGSVGRQVRLRLAGSCVLQGALTRAGRGWVLVRDEQARLWLVPTHAVLTATGLGPHAVHDDARTVLARLGIGSVLRRLADDRASCVLHLVDGRRCEGRLGRVGADFVEVHAYADVDVMPVAALAALTSETTG